MYVAVFAIGLINYQKQRNKYDNNVYFVYAVIFLFIANVLGAEISVSVIGKSLLYIIIIWLVMVLPIGQKKVILDFQTKWLSLLLIISFVAWVFHFFSSMPFSYAYRPNFEHLPPAYNYYFFITTYAGLFDYRFHSVFLEPGHLGCIISFLVLANQYNFKNKYVQVLAVVLLFTLSLAGFVLFFIGFLFYSIAQKKASAKLRKIFAIGLVFGGIWLFGTYYNGGDNYINERIIERLQYDDESGDIAGDNRYTEEMDRTFEQTLTGSDLLFGLSINQFRHFRENAGTGAGIKLWFIQKGLVGTLSLFLGYFFIARGSRNRRWAMFMLLVYVISSYQRMYFFWASYLIPFICGSYLPIITKEEEIEKKKII